MKHLLDIIFILHCCELHWLLLGISWCWLLVHSIVASSLVILVGWSLLTTQFGFSSCARAKSFATLLYVILLHAHHLVEWWAMLWILRAASAAAVRLKRGSETKKWCLKEVWNWKMMDVRHYHPFRTNDTLCNVTGTKCIIAQNYEIYLSAHST